jgi:hypothetical protein
MKTAVIAAVVLALATLCSPAAKAWDCPAGQQRVQAPAGTPTTAPFYDVVEGIAFICEPIPPTTPPPSTSSNSSNSTSSANSNSTSASNSTSKSNSNSTSNATGGNASSVATGGNQKQNQNQTQVATGGNATGGNASAQGGASSANGNGVGNGNGSNNASYSSNSVTNVAASKIPVASAIAPPVLPANPCFKGFGAAVQTMVVGGSFGGGKIDGNCAILETARLAPSLLAKCKVYITDKYAKAAGVTLEDCMIQEEAAVPAPVQVESAAPVQVQPVVVNVQPAAPVVVPAPAVNVIVPAAPAPSVVVRSSKPHVPQSSKKCVQKTCPTEKPTVFTNDGHGNVVKEYQN